MQQLCFPDFENESRVFRKIGYLARAEFGRGECRILTGSRIFSWRLLVGYVQIVSCVS